MHKLLNFVGVLLLAGLAGIFLVQYLVSQPAWRYLHLTLSLICMVGACVWLVSAFPDPTRIWMAVLALAAFLGGYLGRNAAFLGLEEVRALPAITRAENSPGAGHTAIIYFTHGEPAQYDPLPWIETMREFDQDQAEFIPVPFRPFFFYTFRSEYLQIGTSPHNEIHAALVDQLSQNLQAVSPTTQVYLAFLDSDPRPDEMLIRAINEGASRVIVMPVFVTVSSHTQAGEELIAALQPEKYGLEVCQASPLWDAELLQQSFVERTNAHLGETAKAKTGVLLIGHGQPAAWDGIYPTQTEQENLYREAIKAKLVAEGYSPENVVLAWMEFKTPSIETGLQELAAHGVEKIIVFSTSISAKSIHSEIEVPKAIAAAKLPAQITVLDLGAWGNPEDKLLLAALQEKIAQCAPELKPK